MVHWTDFLDSNGPDGAYLPWKKVEPRVGISRTTAWRLQKTGDFPKPYVVSPGRVAYRESEVEAWKASRGHRNATSRPPLIQACMMQSSQAPPSPSEPPSWSPAPPTSSLTIPPTQGAPSPSAPLSRTPRRSARVRAPRSSGDQIEFKF